MARVQAAVVAREGEKVVILTGRVELVKHRVRTEEITPHQSRRKEEQVKGLHATRRRMQGISITKPSKWRETIGATN